MRALRGQREVFRRLEEQREGYRQRRNEIRQMGGLEPIEEETNYFRRAINLGYIRNYNEEFYQRLYREMGIRREYIQGLDPIAATNYLTDTHIQDNGVNIRANYIYVDTANLNHHVYDRHNFRTFANHATDTEYNPYVVDTVPDFNEMSEDIFKHSTAKPIDNNRLKVKMKTLLGEKFESNNDYAFLLNKEK
jgi:hypothetical protein